MTTQHHTALPYGGERTARLAAIALLSALSYMLTFIEFPLFPGAPWLLFDPSGVVAFLAGLMMGPVAGSLVVILPWTFKTLVTFNVYGHLMAIIAGLSLMLPVWVLYQRITTHKAMYLAMPLGGLCSLVACVGFNLIVTPLYTALPLEQVVPLVITMVIPFNILKIILTCVLVILIYRPLAHLIKH